MKKIYRGAITTVFAIVFVMGLAHTARAATSPSLGSASTFSIFSSTFTNSNTSPQTAITGDICFTTPPATFPISIIGATVTPCNSTNGIDQGSMLSDLNSQPCISLGAAVTLSGTYAPGCYSSTGAMDIVASTTVTLSGSGVFIFRPGGALTTGADSIVTLTGGACASDVFWAPGAATTIGANSSLSVIPTFIGNIIDAAGISFGHFANLSGRALAFGGTVTTDANTITVPTCVSSSTLRIVKAVAGGTAVPSDFTMHVRFAGVDIAGSPAVGTSTPGIAYSLSAGTYVVSEDANASYAQSFSGSCNASGIVVLASGASSTCTVTNTFIPPPPPVVIPTVSVGNNNYATTTPIVTPTVVPTSTTAVITLATTSVAIATNIATSTQPSVLFTPAFPDTGFSEGDPRNIVIVLSLFIVSFLYVVLRKEELFP